MQSQPMVGWSFTAGAFGCVLVVLVAALLSTLAVYGDKKACGVRAGVALPHIAVDCE